MQSELPLFLCVNAVQLAVQHAVCLFKLTSMCLYTDVGVDIEWIGNDNIRARYLNTFPYGGMNSIAFLCNTQIECSYLCALRGIYFTE